MTDQTTSSDEAAAHKAAVRAAALAARAAIGEAERVAAAQAVAGLGGELVADEKPARVSLFVSVRGEIETLPLAKKLHAAGVPLCLPVILEKNAPLVFRAWAPGDALEEKRFGLREPLASAPEVTPDLLFVPLAAFDQAGGRIGYGGGFYDRTLERLRADGPAMAIGLAFACQEIDRAPREAHDVALDGVLTEAGYRSS